MMEINLLPPEHRPVERTPLPRLMTILLGVLLSTAGVVAWAWLSLVIVPKAARDCEAQKQAMIKAKGEADEVQKIESELNAFKARENVLRGLFNERVCWARLLDRLAEARAKMKEDEEVVLTNVEFKKTAALGLAVPGRPAETRQLYLKGFVASRQKDAPAGGLRKIYLGFIEVLTNDKAFASEFEGDPRFLGDRLVDDLRNVTVAGGRDPRNLGELPKAVLEFEVSFDFKPLQLPAPPAPLAAAPAPVKN
jgi:Tfp pilus assembly protein PilN